ncbi:MAG: hypothetical protein HC923_01520 [Myxococcales bacterium]|nr:hypothetical protein [Myxococcales bacterium]
MRNAEPLPETTQRNPLGSAVHRAILEARQRWIEEAKNQPGRLGITLVLDEAAVPLRVQFGPDGQGGQRVAFVVGSLRDRQELRRLMPEIETALAELPARVTDVRVEIDPNRDFQVSKTRTRA